LLANGFARKSNIIVMNNKYDVVTNGSSGDRIYPATYYMDPKFHGVNPAANHAFHRQNYWAWTALMVESNILSDNRARTGVHEYRQ
jgi:hypothetical protein